MIKTTFLITQFLNNRLPSSHCTRSFFHTVCAILIKLRPPSLQVTGITGAVMLMIARKQGSRRWREQL